ncbi:TolC family protein [candidate division TA06 bacterium]|uniref:TolC family protein n=1 Tax=candidate division TA06 bacterium TaxID=2250710 RepID=A0A523UZ10_UNCT6|nr:MAG: TolC family protein [candidate division TA06 bacterium]
MRLFRLTILMQTALLILTATSAICAGITLSLDECIELALKNNPTIIRNREAVSEAEIGVTISRSSYFPRLDASSSYTRSGNGISRGSYSSGLSFSQILFQGGRNIAVVNAAKAQTEIAVQNLRQRENEIVESVKGIFYSVIKEQDQLSLTDDVLKRRNEDLILIRLKYRAGTESDAAVSEAEANFSQAEYDKLAADERLRLAKLRLNLSMGKPREALLEVRTTEHLPDFPSRSEVVAMGLRHRPEMAREASRVKLQRAYQSQSKGGFFPTFRLNASFNRSGDRFLADDNSWSAGVNASLPLFDGLRTPADYFQSRVSLRRQLAQYEETRQSVEENIEKAYSDWLLAKKRMEVAEKSLTAATEIYNLNRLQYQQGRASYFSFQQRELSLTRAEYERVNASYNLFVSTAELERAIGKSLSAELKGEE